MPEKENCMKHWTVATFVALLILTLGLPLTSGAIQFKDPGAEKGEKLTYEVSYDNIQKFEKSNLSASIGVGEFPVRFTVKVDKIKSGGKDIIKVTRDEVLYNKNRAENIYIIEVKDKGALRLIEHRKKVRDKRNVVIRDYITRFDDPSLRYPSDTIHPTLTPFILRGAVFKKGTQYKYTTWMNEVNLLKMIVNVKGRETIKVPAGTFECIKIEVKPDVSSIIGNKAFAKVVKPFIPKLIFWFDTGPGHKMIKFKGTAIGPGSPKSVHTLVSIEKAG